MSGEKDDWWTPDVPPRLPPWTKQKQHEHPCVMCGKRTLIHNLGRCKPCDKKWEATWQER